MNKIETKPAVGNSLPAGFAYTSSSQIYFSFSGSNGFTQISIYAISSASRKYFSTENGSVVRLCRGSHVLNRYLFAWVSHTPGPVF